MAGLGHRQDRGVMLPPLDEIDGFMVRPGFYNSEGAVPTARGVSFTIHSVGATGCTLLLFRPQEKEPYARLKYPEAYHIGNTFAMLVFGLKIDEFEYAFQLDGPYDESRGLLFDKNNVLLDPFAKAVTGQRNWGERPESDEGFVYHARVVDGVQLYNYWGYNTVSFFAPNTSYSSVVEHNHEGDELKLLISELKANGMEVILDVVFNHTAEGNENGPCFSFKGIDNNIYYMLTPDGHYYNFSGCGNAMNCNHPIMRKFIIDCLRYWVMEYRVDGFRFDLASILTRDQNGAPMPDPPILQGIACDPILGHVKLIAEAWDAAGLYQVGSFPAFRRWSEWNGRYRDDMRRFLKGDGSMAGTAINRIIGSTDLYDPVHRGESASVNFLTCHDGFTLYDLYSYNTKHNEKNGWNNTDGDNNGNSWNCGVEGETDDPQIEGLRRRMVKNAFATLLCSRGPAMFYGGDEFCNTQFGNNNAYCQDNIISWLDWTRLEKYREIHDFVRYMIGFRKRYAILRKKTKPVACNLPEISIHNGYPWNGGTDSNSRLIGIMYAGRDEHDTRDDIVFYCMNAYWETLVMQLPELPNGLQWKVCVNTSVEYKDGRDMESYTEFYYKKTLKVPPRTAIVLVAE